MKFVGSEKIAGIFAKFDEYIKSQLLADTIEKCDSLSDGKEWNINGESVILDAKVIK